MNKFRSLLLKCIQEIEHDKVKLTYGTAGFRSKSENMDCCIHRCAIFVGLCSIIHTKKGYGLVITASHNPSDDNGVKLIDYQGNMLNVQHSNMLENFVNCELAEEAIKSIDMLLGQIDQNGTISGTVLIGQDTRKSSKKLAKIAESVLKQLNFNVIGIGQCTTPMLHWIVKSYNINDKVKKLTPKEMHNYYYSTFRDKFENLFKCLGILPMNGEKKIYCDGAGGIGSICINNFSDVFKKLGYTLDIRNTVIDDNLNYNCGSDFIHKTEKFPSNFSDIHELALCFSFDGDADRILFFTKYKNEFTLIDGDKITLVIATSLAQIFNQLGKKLTSEAKEKLKFGIVQTSYANKQATEHLAKLKITNKLFTYDIVYSKTGVANLHRAAQKYDIAIYFESNGHGNILYKEKNIKKWARTNNIDTHKEFEQLMYMLYMSNDTVGDAMTDCMLFLVCIKFMKLSLEKIVTLYKNNPYTTAQIPMSREILDKIRVDPEHEQRLVDNHVLQNKIDEEVKKYSSSRAFIRPSGTEPVCRIYAEAKTKQDSDALANNIIAAVKQHYHVD